jgi:hypothetical protein
MNAKKDSKVIKIKGERAAAKIAKRNANAEETMAGQSIKALRKLTYDQIECVRCAMSKLKDGYTSTSANDMVDHFDTLREFGMAKDSRFNRTTGKPELKKVLTKKGQKVFKYLFPKPSSLGR